MSVTLSPVSPRVAVQDADDPFKKYWWGILLGIAFTGLWLLMPMLGERSIGSVSVDPMKPKADENAEQSLTSALDAGPNLSMDGTGAQKKAGEDYAGSMLYQPPPEEAAPADAAAAGAAAGGGATLASQLKSVSEGKSASNGGWGDKVAQRGFNSPKLSGNSLSGMGAASGGRAASASGGSGLGAFGSKNAQIGYAGTKGLSGGDDAEKAAAAGSRGVAALRQAADQARQAAMTRSGDGASNSLAKAFDGAKGQNSIAGGLGASIGGSYEALDSAPVNLKMDDPKLNSKELKEPPSQEMPEIQKTDDIGQQLALSMVGIIVGGAIGGVAGGIISSTLTSIASKVSEYNEAKREADIRAEWEQKQAACRMGAAQCN
jgi:hypothetical protein